MNRPLESDEENLRWPGLLGSICSEIHRLHKASAGGIDLFLKLRATTHLSWSGRYRPALNGQGVYPRPHQTELPVWLGVGGTPQSFVRVERSDQAFF